MSSDRQPDERELPAPPGRDSGVFSTVQPTVFWISVVLLLLYVGASVLFSESAQVALPALGQWVGRVFGPFYVVSVALFLIFVFVVAASPVGRIRLGRDDEQPEFSRLTWFAMLFSAGMGIGLVFNGVAEPMNHFARPPLVEGGSAEAAEVAIQTTYFHWGLHAWAIYVVVGLSIAFFAFRRGLPLALRSCFYPILGERIHGWAGHVVDIAATFGTLFGLAASLGMGATQVAEGLERIVGIPSTTANQVLLIAAITLAATVSLLSGVNRGIRRLSELNLILATLLMLFVFLAGPTLFILERFAADLVGHVGVIADRTFLITGRTEQEAAWMRTWTMPFWGWWIAWAPFVGMFVARVSKGRTIREFILGVVLAPTLVTFFWFSVFGNTALHLEASGVPIAAAVQDEISTAIYVTLEELPWSTVASALAALVVTIFFVTSSDSASYVVDMLTSKPGVKPSRWQRVFWASAEGVVAAVLLSVGGEETLRALQAAVVTIGLPFCALMVLMVVALAMALWQELRRGAS